jgi:hypothetical protein
MLALLGVNGDANTLKGSLDMISPWMSNDTLMEFLRRANGSAIDHRLLVSPDYYGWGCGDSQLPQIQDIAMGLHYLHSQSFAHSDLHGVRNLFSVPTCL